MIKKYKHYSSVEDEAYIKSIRSRMEDELRSHITPELNIDEFADIVANKIAIISTERLINFVNILKTYSHYIDEMEDFKDILLDHEKASEKRLVLLNDRILDKISKIRK